jgi:hypothetical protein
MTVRDRKPVDMRQSRHHHRLTDPGARFDGWRSVLAGRCSVGDVNDAPQHNCPIRVSGIANLGDLPGLARDLERLADPEFNPVLVVRAEIHRGQAHHGDGVSVFDVCDSKSDRVTIHEHALCQHDFVDHLGRLPPSRPPGPENSTPASQANESIYPGIDCGQFEAKGDSVRVCPNDVFEIPSGIRGDGPVRAHG